MTCYQKERACGRYPVGSGVEVRRYQTNSGETRVHFAGLSVCADANRCPTCSQRIKAARAVKLGQECEAWGLHYGPGSIGFLTSTIRHNRDHTFLELKKGLLKAFNKTMTSLRRKVPTKGNESFLSELDYDGTIRAMETTLSKANGFHVHLHTLVLFKRPLSLEDEARAHQHIGRVWQKNVIKALGESCAPNLSNGSDFKAIRSSSDANKVGQYLSKLVLSCQRLAQRLQKMAILPLLKCSTRY